MTLDTTDSHFWQWLMSNSSLPLKDIKQYQLTKVCLLIKALTEWGQSNYSFIYFDNFESAESLLNLKLTEKYLRESSRNN